MKKCVQCGKENVDEAIYCADCGAKLGTVYNSSTSSSASTTDNSLNYSSNQTSNQGYLCQFVGNGIKYLSEIR